MFRPADSCEEGLKFLGGIENALHEKALKVRPSEINISSLVGGVMVEANGCGIKVGEIV